MAGFQFVIDVAGDTQVMRGFSRMADNVKDLSEAFREIVQDFHERVETQQFESEGRYGSGGWQPLTPRYAERKEKEYPGTPIMVRTGLLKESLLGQNPYSREDIKPLEMRVGTQVGYAKFHQKGTKKKGTKKMVARPLIQLTEADKTRFTKIIHRYLVEQANKEWAGLMPTIGAGEAALRRI